MKSIRAGHCWVHKLFEHVQNFRTDLPKLHGPEERCSNLLSLSLSLLEWPRMTRNDHSNKFELSIRPHSGVDSAQWDWGIMTINSNSVLLIRVTWAGHNMFKRFVYPGWIIFIPAYVHWKPVVIFFVTKLMCCILVILTIYYVIRACNISDEWSANVTQ